MKILYLIKLQEARRHHSTQWYWAGVMVWCVSVTLHFSDTNKTMMEYPSAKQPTQ